MASGWHGQRFARMKHIKALGEYLKPALTPEQKRNEGARKVRAMLERMARKGGG